MTFIRYSFCKIEIIFFSIWVSINLLLLKSSVCADDSSVGEYISLLLDFNHSFTLFSSLFSLD